MKTAVIIRLYVFFHDRTMADRYWREALAPRDRSDVKK